MVILLVVVVVIVVVADVVVEYGHLIEIYDFPPELQTRDLLAAFIEYK